MSPIMNPIKTTARLASAAAVLAFGAADPAAAGSHSLTMKPLHGVSFDAGAERAVSYFVAERGACKLVVTLAPEPDWDNGASQTYRRVEATVAAEKATQLRSEGGRTFEFFCEAGAVAMSVTEVQTVAAGSAR